MLLFSKQKSIESKEGLSMENSGCSSCDKIHLLDHWDQEGERFSQKNVQMDAIANLSKSISCGQEMR